MGETNKPITLDLPEGVPVDVILQPHESVPPDHKGTAARHVADALYHCYVLRYEP